MKLNDFRDEAAKFMEQMVAEPEPISKIMKMLDEEITLLKESLGDQECLNHQLYDVLFLLFEIATICNLDLDLEWTKGRERKRIKYS